MESSIEAINKRIDELYDAGRYAEAITLAEEVCNLTADHFGENHSEYASSLNMLAGLYRLTQDYTTAESLYQQIAKIDRATLGIRHSQYAADLVDLADLYSEMGYLLKAESLYRQAIEIDGAILAPTDETLLSEIEKLEKLHESMRAQSSRLSQAAEEHQRRKDYSAAEPLYQEIAEIQSRLNAYANMQSTVEPFYERPVILDQRQELAARRALLKQKAFQLNELGLQYYEMGVFDEAEQAFLQALELHRRIFGENHSDTAGVLNNLGALYKEMGLFVQAAELWLQALQIRKKICKDDDPELAFPAHNLAYLYQEMEEYAAAAPLYADALRIQRKAFGYDHSSFVTTLSNVATAFLNALGDHERLKRVAPLEPVLNQFLIKSRKSGLASLLETAFRHILTVYQNRYGELHPKYAISLNNLSGLFYKTGRFEEAEPLVQQGISICRKTKGRGPTLAKMLTNLAELYAATGRMTEALSLMNEATVINDHSISQLFGVGSEHDREIFVGFITAFVSDTSRVLSLLTQHLSTDADAVRMALGLVLRRKGIEAEAFAAQRDAVLGGRYPELEPLIRRLSELRSKLVQETFSGPGEEGLEAHEQRLGGLERKKEDIEAELARRIPEIRLEHKFRTADRQAIALALPADSALIEFVRFRACDFNAVAVRGEPFWNEYRYLAFILPANEPNEVGLIDLGSAKALDRMISTFRKLLTDEDDSRGLLEGISPISNTDQESGPGMKLRVALFDPLLQKLSDLKRFFLAPDGDLTRLPFEVLPLNDKQRVGDEFRISYLTSGRDILRFGTRSGREPSEPFVAADPDFDLSDSSIAIPSAGLQANSRQIELTELRNLQFGRLPGTRVEGERVGALLGVKPLTEADAVESRLKATRSPRVLHLATHGFFLPNPEEGSTKQKSQIDWDGNLDTQSFNRFENPLLRSGLALAGANSWLKKKRVPEEAEDGILTAEDVSGLDLLDTELAVLSACETGLGEVATGEGVLGLRRAFALAGAKTLVMSLWKVPDLSTAILMERFYLNLLENKMDRDEALHAAQMYVRDLSLGELRETWLTEAIIARLAAGDRRMRRHLGALLSKPDDYAPFSAPKFWGAFICQGDPARI